MRSVKPEAPEAWVLEEVLINSWQIDADVDIREIDKTIYDNMGYLESLPPSDTIQYFRYVVKVRNDKLCLYRQRTRTRA